MEQAKKWAFIVTKGRNYGKATVSVFETSDLGKLDILKFKGANINWLKYVVNNRKNIYQNNNYDLVIGPVANDNTMPVISLYLENVLNEEETVKMYEFSPLAIFDMWENEKITGTPQTSVYLRSVD